MGRSSRIAGGGALCSSKTGTQEKEVLRFVGFKIQLLGASRVLEEAGFGQQKKSTQEKQRESAAHLP